MNGILSSKEDAQPSESTMKVVTTAAKPQAQLSLSACQFLHLNEISTLEVLFAAASAALLSQQRFGATHKGPPFNLSSIPLATRASTPIPKSVAFSSFAMKTPTTVGRSFGFSVPNCLQTMTGDCS
jgi:hypothetical protein